MESSLASRGDIQSHTGAYGSIGCIGGEHADVAGRDGVCRNVDGRAATEQSCCKAEDSTPVGWTLKPRGKHVRIGG